MDGPAITKPKCNGTIVVDFGEVVHPIPACISEMLRDVLIFLALRYFRSECPGCDQVANILAELF